MPSDHDLNPLPSSFDNSIKLFVNKALNFEEQKRINIYSFDSGKKIGVYIPDFVVENKIIVEIKATNFLTNSDIEQQSSYLRISSYEIAYLVNFCTDDLYINRSIFTNDRKEFLKKLSK